MELPGESVDDPWGGVSADADLAAVGRDGEDVRGTAEGGDGHPPRIRTERDVLRA